MGTTTRKKKRPYDDGSVYQRSSDGRWVAKYKPEHEIKPIQRYAKTEKEAKQKLKELKRLEAKGIHTSNQKISDLMETWLETFRSVKLKPGSYDATESNYLCHIKPFLGDYQPHHITSMML